MLCSAGPRGVSCSIRKGYSTTWLMQFDMIQINNCSQNAANMAATWPRLDFPGIQMGDKTTKQCRGYLSEPLDRIQNSLDLQKSGHFNHLR